MRWLYGIYTWEKVSDSNLSKYRNIAQAKAIEKSNKQRLLKVNPKLDDEKVPIIYRHCQHTFEVL